MKHFEEDFGEMHHWAAATGDKLIKTMAETMPWHYLDRLGDLLTAHGSAGVAALLKVHRPSGPRAESGDWAEVLATEVLRKVASPYEIPINRLCWKDCPLPMRGDDILGFNFGATPFRVLKVESKGGASIPNSVLVNARLQIDKNNGLPSAHTMSFVAARLRENGRDSDAFQIEHDLIHNQMTPGRVEHAIFFTSGTTNIVTALEADARSAQSPIRRRSYLVHVDGYASAVTTTINQVFDANAQIS